MSDILIRPAGEGDRDALWRALAPAIREGETYALPRDMEREAALGWLFDAAHAVFVAARGGAVIGGFLLRANKAGGGAHVANAAFFTAPEARGGGVASALCGFALDEARRRGFRAMQFNFVIASNEGAVRLWERFGFETVGRLPRAFAHPRLGEVDALVMHRFL
jgi:ribosomal protein S18 acetylase RimI-like enzyme